MTWSFRGQPPPPPLHCTIHYTALHSSQTITFTGCRPLNTQHSFYIYPRSCLSLIINGLYLYLDNHHMKAPQSWGMWRSPATSPAGGWWSINIWWHDGSMNIIAACGLVRARVLCRAAGLRCGMFRWATVRPPTGLHHTNTLHHFTQTDTLPAGQIVIL